MRVQDTLQELSEKVSSDELTDLTKEQLETYSSALCFSAASHYFAPNQFSQVCETIRLLLLKKYTEDIDLKNKEHTEEMNEKHFFLQKIVIVLATLSFIGTATQVYLAVSTPTQQSEISQQYKQKVESKPTVIRAPR